MGVLFPARSLVHFHGHTEKAQILHSAWVGLPFHEEHHRLRVQHAQHLWVALLRLREVILKSMAHNRRTW